MIRDSLSLMRRALKANFVPALFLWSVGLGLMLGYYHVDVITRGFDRLLRAREEIGWVYPLLSMMLFAVILPLATQYAFLPAERPRILRRALWMLPFFAYKGWEVDFFYAWQADFWGADTSFATISAKVLTDMLLYTPIVAIPSIALYMRWTARRTGDLPSHTPFFPKHWVQKVILPVLILNGLIWWPSVCIVYQMPTPLQLPLANLITWFWSLILIFASKNEAQDSVVPPPVQPLPAKA